MNKCKSLFTAAIVAVAITTGSAQAEVPLPDGYMRLAYIESTADQQYIDTQYMHQPGDEVVLDAYIPQQSGICAAFGAQTTDGGYFYLVPCDTSSNPPIAGYRNGSGTQASCATPFQRNRRDKITCKGATATWRDGSLEVASATWPAGKNKMLIFARNRSYPLEVS